MKDFFNSKKILLGLIILLGLAIRSWKLTELPFPPDGDEIAFAYYGWSLLNFGVDDFGNKFPLVFKSIGDFKYPGLAYLNVIPASLFGLSDLTPRFWSLISGVLAIPLIYIFSYFISRNYIVSILSAFLFSISPWSLIASRIGYENHVSLTLCLAGFVLLLSSTRQIKKGKRLSQKHIFAISIALFLVSIFTYAAERVFIPLFLFTLYGYSFIDSGLNKSRNSILIALLITSVTSAALLSNPDFRGRAGEDVWKSTAEDKTKLEATYHASGISDLKPHPRVTWFLNNKYTFAASSFAKRYWDHFSPDFLFFEGEATDERIPGMGVLLFAQIILLPVGVYYVIELLKKRSWLIFGWLILAPIPSSLTHGGAHINRALLMVIPLTIISAFGLFGLTTWKPKLLRNISSTIIIAAIFWSFAFTLHQFFVVKPFYQPWYKQQVNKELTQKVLALKDKYKSVVVTDDDYIFYLFYGKISPRKFIENADLSESDRWERVNKLYNIHFKMPFDCPLSGKEEALYVCSGDQIPQNSQLVDVVYYKDGLPAYTLIEFFPLSKRATPLPKLPERLHYMVEVEKPDGNPDGTIPAENNFYW